MRHSFIIAATSLLLCALPAKADRVLDAFSAKAASSTVEFNYSFAVKSESIPFTGDGKASVCGEGFHVKGNGLDIWCDGKNRWTVDTDAKEVIVEKVSGADDSYSVNPALFITNVSAFKELSSGDAAFRGKTYHCVALSPKVQSSISEVKLFFTGNDLKSASVKLKDGTVTEFVISGLVFSDKRSSYTFDQKSLGSSWIVTDLSDF